MTRKIIIYCLFFLTAYLIFQSLIAFSSTNDTKADLDTPYNSIYTHLSFLQHDNYKPKVSAKALNTTRINPENAEDLAIKLKRIFDGRGLMVTMEQIPKESNYFDSSSQEHKYILFPEIPDIYLQKYGNKWLYSLETVAHIEDIYKSTFPIDAFTFIDELPEFWKISILTIHLWQITGLLLAAILCCAIYVISYWILSYLLVKVSSKFFKHKLYIKYIKPISKPISLFLVFWIFDQLVSALGMPVKVSFIIGLIIRAIQPILITFIVFRLSDFFVDILASLASKTKSSIDDHLVPFVSKGLRFVIIIFGVLYFFSNVGIDITPLIAGVSIGGLAFALAAQDTVKNLFGSLTIFTDQPFQIGDWIVADGAEGTVEEVGIRSTRIRTFYN
jgi:MscS family membrane protein